MEDRQLVSSEPIIIIPTLGRVRQQMTLDRLSEDWCSRTWLCVPAREADQHTHPRLLVHNNIDGIAKTRQFILESVDAPAVFMLDDDLRFEVRRCYAPKPRMRKANCEDVGACFDQLTSWLREDSDLGLVAISSRQGNHVEMAACSDRPGRVCRAWGYRPEVVRALPRFRFDDLEFAEDFHLVLSLLRNGLNMRTSFHWAQGQTASNAPGGCSLVRTKESHAAAMSKLAELHPGFVKVVQKHTKGGWFGDGVRTDSVISWKKAAEAGSTIVNTTEALTTMVLPATSTALAVPSATPAIDLPAAKHWLVQTDSVPDIKDLRDRAASVRDHLRRQRAHHEQQNDAAELKMCAERRLGELLDDMQIVPGGRRIHDETAGRSDLRGAERSLPEGITKIQAHRWRKVAHISEAEFAAYVKRTRETGGELTSAGLDRFAEACLAMREAELDLAPGGSLGITGDVVTEEPGLSPHTVPDDYPQLVQLFLPARQKRLFADDVLTLQTAYGTTNQTDTIVECVRRAVSALRSVENRDVA